MNQAIAAVVKVGYYWKYQDRECDTTDLDTVPAKPRARGKALKACTFTKIAEKILSSDQSLKLTIFQMFILSPKPSS